MPFMRLGFEDESAFALSEAPALKLFIEVGSTVEIINCAIAEPVFWR
jgi:hypothetical protein